MSFHRFEKKLFDMFEILKKCFSIIYENIGLNFYKHFTLTGNAGFLNLIIFACINSCSLEKGSGYLGANTQPS